MWTPSTYRQLTKIFDSQKFSRLQFLPELPGQLYSYLRFLQGCLMVSGTKLNLSIDGYDRGKLVVVEWISWVALHIVPTRDLPSYLLCTFQKQSLETSLATSQCLCPGEYAVPIPCILTTYFHNVSTNGLKTHENCVKLIMHVTVLFMQEFCSSNHVCVVFLAKHQTVMFWLWLFNCTVRNGLIKSDNFIAFLARTLRTVKHHTFST